jgi:hypothetical protein
VYMEDNIKVDLKNIDWTGFIWPKIGISEYGNKHSASIKRKEFID